MSSVLRASKLVMSRQRLHQQRILSSPPTPHRNLSWAPAAYRRQTTPVKSSSRGGRKRRPVKKIGKGRDGLWKHLQETYGNPNDTTDAPNNNNNNNNNNKSSTKQHDDDEQHDYLVRKKLDTTRKELKEALNHYRSTLFPALSKKKKNPTTPELLNTLHKECLKAGHTTNDSDEKIAVVSMETLLQTEDDFQNLGKLLGRVLSLTTRLSANELDDNGHQQDITSPSVAAEDLLKKLLTLKLDRTLLYKRAQEAQQKQQQQQEQENSSGIMGWLKNVLVFSSGDDDDESSSPTEQQQQVVLAHEAPKFGPTSNQFGKVLKRIQYDVRTVEWQPPYNRDTYNKMSQIFKIRNESQDARNQLMDSANRMLALLELHTKYGGEPVVSLTGRTIHMFARVGTLQAANQANHVYTDICLKKVSRSIFQNVLQAYRLAALMEDTEEARRDAATKAIALLKEREAYHNVFGGNDPKGESLAIVLDTLNNAGHQAMPERITQTENLLKLWVGESVFHQVVFFRKGRQPPAAINMALFETLMMYYAREGNRNLKLLTQAENILECAVQVQSQVDGDDGEDSMDNDEKKRVFPNTASYNAILWGTRARLLVLQGNGTTKRKTFSKSASFATSYLDRMNNEACLPNLNTFGLLFEIWAMTELPESAQQAEDLLSRMNIQQACSAGPSDAWDDISRVYSHFLRCLASGPNASSADTLQRALRILLKMEAESGIQYKPSPNAPREEHEIWQSIHVSSKTQSYRDAYNGALKICSLCVDDSETAFQSAFDIYNRMIAAGVTPDNETFTYLFATCLLPGKDGATNDRRRELAQTVIAFASDHGVNTGPMMEQLRAKKTQKKRR